MRIIKDLANEVYHSDAAISRSGIREFLRSPYHYWSEYLNPKAPPRKFSDAMKMGSAFHTYILEYDKFEDDYEVEPPKVLLKDVGRKAYDEYKLQLQELLDCGKIILSPEEYNILRAMEESLVNNQIAMDLISDCEYEVSLFWSDPHTQIACKARPDIVGKEYIADLKTISSADFRTFQSSIDAGAYHIQAAMIRDAYREITGKDYTQFIYICVENKYPFATAIYILNEEALEIGRAEYKQALLDMKICFEKNEWLSYQIQTIGLPAWKKK